MIFAYLATWLINRAKRTPYFHLHHADGSLYMERYWLVPFPDTNVAGCFVARWWQPLIWLLQRLDIAARIHCIHTPDLDRHLHDHPWSFISVVLRGYYVEQRPITIKPCFDDEVNPFLGYREDVELTRPGARRQGSIAYRRSTDRHCISYVPMDGVWTLFITFRKVQWWGFYTPKGKVYWEDYESVHNNKPIEEATNA